MDHRIDIPYNLLALAFNLSAMLFDIYKYYHTILEMSTGKFNMITNYLSPISFKIVIDRLPNVEFFTQRVQIPGLSMGAPQQLSPLHNIYRTPDRIEYAELDLSFLVDENMNNYNEILSWMEGMGSPENTDQRLNLEKSKYGEVSDVSIVIENSNRRPNIKFTFTDAFPLALSGISLDVTGTDVIYPEASVTMRYTNMRFEKIS